MNLPIYVKEKSNFPTSKLDIGSRLFEDNIVYLFGEINEEASYTVVQQFMYLSSKDPQKEIILIINSPGGSVNAGFAIYDAMRSISNDVVTVCIGVAASMAAFLLSSGKKGSRFIYPNAEVMIHEVVGGGYGQVSDINITAEHINRIKHTLNKYLAKNTGKTLAKVEKDTERDNWMTSKEAIKYGLVDKIIKQKDGLYHE